MITLELSTQTNTGDSSSTLHSVPMAWLKWSEAQDSLNESEEDEKDLQPGNCDSTTTQRGRSPQQRQRFPPPPPRRLNSKVQFHTDDDYEPGGGPPVLTEQERALVWYTKREIHGMRSDTKEQVREQGIRHDTENFSVRGLEDTAFVRTAVEKKARKAAVIQGVLKEQERLWLMQLEDSDTPKALSPEQQREEVDKLLRKKSKSASKDAVKIALHLASQDAKDAREHHNPNPNPDDKDTTFLFHRGTSAAPPSPLGLGWSRRSAVSGGTSSNTSNTALVSEGMHEKVQRSPSLLKTGKPPFPGRGWSRSTRLNHFSKSTSEEKTKNKLGEASSVPGTAAAATENEPPATDTISAAELLSTCRPGVDKATPPRSPRVVVPLKRPSRRITRNNKQATENAPPPAPCIH